jgi:hypothetical protein
MADSDDSYNYSKFTMAPFPVDYAGPKAGEQMPPWEGVDVDGKPIASSEFEGRYVVMETGSYTCPMYAGQIEEMTKLAEDAAQAVWLAAILPSPRRYARGTLTPYLESRIWTIRGRMAYAQIP